MADSKIHRSVAVIGGEEALKICRELEKEVTNPFFLSVDGVTSLTKVILDDEDQVASGLERTPAQPPLTHLVIWMDGDGFRWTDSHIYAVQRKADIILMGSGKQYDRLRAKQRFHTAATVQDILHILNPAAATPESPEISAPIPAISAKAPLSSGQSVDSTAPQRPYTYLKEQEIVPQLVRKYPKCSNPIRVDVAGVEGKIGCTTQAIALWHYFDRLGFTPAIMGEKSQQKQLGGTPAADGYTVAGVRFTTKETGGFNCYIQDVSMSGDMTPNADILVMVAGLKPWEWSATKDKLLHADEEILQYNKRLRIVVLVSYATQETYQNVALFFQRLPYPHAAVTYPNSDIWNPPDDALRMLDGLLRAEIDAVCEEKAGGN